MDVVATVVGNYPRPEWFREYLRKVEGLQKDLDVEVEREVLRKAIAEVIDEQKKAGIELYTDGQLIWHDFLLTIASRLEGFEMNGLVRYFDNNLYYRIPIAKSKIKRTKKILYDFEIAFEIEKNIKAVLSCYTVAKLSRNEFYPKFEDFLWDICEAIKEEIKELEERGVKYIQIDEPALLYAEKSELEVLKDVYKELTNTKMETILMTYFDSAERIFPEVLDFGFDVIGLDFVEGYEENLKVVEEYDFSAINVGLIDGRNTKMESLEELKVKFEEITSKGNFKKVYISPNTGLEFLPRIKAFEKMQLVAKLKGVVE
ncbi:hypothetical protein [Archaeoglobus profundus]|uniref:Cobalamin-independent synthase MetE domain protein n=1 Tax=Archaeoglobus profundus (strain DSM 5631 / JCM 9629 / NBRC 100127 / Av18) TaxID=572546 RepID=D2RFP5_ARCPA|nr:hypothetical protein [Archaeoglobus profundus]ADB57120.1 Cobalamin-independent synthase MetE domain protein [Archaeoglobus profundus DSM 5631]